MKQFDLFNQKENIDFLMDEEIKSSVAEAEKSLEEGERLKPRANLVYGVITRLIFKKALPHSLSTEEQKEYAKKIAIKLIDMGYKSSYLKEATGIKNNHRHKDGNDEKPRRDSWGSGAGLPDSDLE